MLSGVIIKYFILFITLSGLVSLLFRLAVILVSYGNHRYTKHKKRIKKENIEDSEIPLELHEKLYYQHKEKKLKKQKAKYQEMHKNTLLHNKKYGTVAKEYEEGTQIVAFAESQGPWTKRVIEELKRKFFTGKPHNPVKSKWTLLVSLSGRNQGKYRGRTK